MTRAHPVFVLHEHHRPRHHIDLRLEEDGVLRSWAVPKGLPTETRHDRLAVAVDDHDLDHATYTDYDVGDRRRRRLVGARGPQRAPLRVRPARPDPGSARYALIDTGSDWLLHLSKHQPEPR